MNDSISRQAAIDAVDNYIGMFDAIDVNFLDGLKTAKQLMTQLPAAQPEIVRCKDCAHYDLVKNGYNGLCTRQNAVFTAYDFCSYGKRKGGDAE